MSGSGARRDGALDGLEVEQEVLAAGHEAVGHGLAAVELDLRLVDREAGVGIEDLVAGVHQAEQELLDHRLAAGLDGDVLRRSTTCRGSRETSAAKASRSGMMPPLGQ